MKQAKPTTKKVLLIEDEGDICFLLNIILKGREIDVDHVNTLAKAKAYLMEQAPELVFLDNSLPDGRGTDFIEFIKMNCPDTKIILITGYGSPVEKERAIHNGANLFLEKPFTKSQISNAVSHLLQVNPQQAMA